MTSRRKFFQQTGAAFSGFMLAGCGWRLAEMRVNPVNSDRNLLNVYTWSQYVDRKLVEGFSNRTGIKVATSVYEANEAMLAKLRAGGGGGYGIIYPSDYMVKKMIDLGLLIKLNRDKLIGLDNLFPKFKNPQYDPNNSYSIPFSWGTTGLIYNSEILDPPPEDWNYLWKNQDKLKKRMTLLNDVREVMGAVLRMLGYSYNSKNESEIKQAYEKLKILKPAIAAFDTDAWRNQILAGDLSLAMCYSSDAVKITQENPKLKYITPKSGSSLWTDTIAIPKTSPNIDGAYKWINFMLQPRVAVHISKRLGVATPNLEGYNQLPDQLQNNTSLFPSESTIENCERLAPVGDLEAIYERYWTKLTSS
ncbi:spermidine/putrescine ABC transporter substrate-binding protein [Mastigocoleus sp. MO_188.B34]|uniref:ABC transporter substrate-binding protein n=1 Tax=Mastigocoleus sp. MO_188.B34 TaxID=3036635 RepID=UPI002632E876|nr:spermidine/putrescine ABC transporter substrate-binding protein [Mastigocoleus sp. MO_188.B34]MDJ0696688.1 spermidine/putrescine ABC transporter substrate-binding protein [Mastigocoleus sp. MO_188.B34]